MSAPAVFRSPRQVQAVFLVVAAVSIVTLGALAWRLLEQDRDLETQRLQVRLDQTAGALAAAMQQALAGLESRLGAGAAGDQPLPPDVVAISIVPDGVVTLPPQSLLYLPEGASGPAPASRVFATGERLEFIETDFAGAATEYARLAAVADPAVRAGALMRLGRALSRRGSADEALAAYASLGELGDTTVEDLPASLVAHYRRMDVFGRLGHAPEREREATALLDGLRSGRWRVTKAQYDTYLDEAGRVLANAPAADRLMVARAEAAAWLWERRGTVRPVERRTLVLPGGAALVIWRSTPERLDGLIAGPAYLASLGSGVLERASDWALSDLEGRPFVGSVRAHGPTAARLPPTTGLPWTLHVFPPEGGGRPASPRRTSLILVLGLVAAVLLAGWFFIYRALVRERRVAALQSDFVNAVSHEFRSPLTALSHAAELLVNDRLTSDVLRRQTYGVLARDTARLRALVEDLLEFGRLEAGATPFTFEDADVGAIVRSTVEEFQEQVAGTGGAITLSGDVDGIRASVDREALCRSLRNLLDNAVKYSPGETDIDVTMSYEAGSVAIAVRDSGLGIPTSEQRAIFDRFVRGAEPKSRRIRGTGIGLAMVRQIVRVHGGEVGVESEPGQGSVFTITLPAREAAGGASAAASVRLADAPSTGRAHS